MSCLDNFIGVKSCSSTAPKSGLYIEDLPGISIPKAAEITDQDPSGVEFLTKKIKFALKDYHAVIMSQLQRQEPRCLELCGFDGEDFKDPSADVVGITITRTPTGLSRLKMRTILVRVKIAGTIQITVTDGVTTTQEDHDLAVGDNLIDFAFNPIGNTISIYATNTLGFGVVDCGDLRVGCGMCDSQRAFKVDGFLNDDKSTTAWGFVPDLCLECDEDRMTCSILHYVKQGALYHAGADILEEWITSTRLNFLTLYSQEWAAAKIDEWRAKAQHLGLSQINGIERHIKRVDPNCFVCADTSHGYIKP